MNKIFLSPFAWLLLSLLTFSACQIDQPFQMVSQNKPLPANLIQSKAKSGELIPDAYIVQFKQDLPELAETVQLSEERLPIQNSQLRQAPSVGYKLTMKVLADNQLPQVRVKKVFNLPGSKGFSLTASKEEVAKLKQDPRIAIVEHDRVIAMGLNPGAKDRLIPSDDGPATQALTYGVSRVGGSVNATGATRFAWIVDSGIDTDHEDLNVNTEYAKSFLPNDASPEDGFGHGTHVAGIIAAKDNGIGVVGIADGVPVVPIRVLDDNGEGTVSSLIEALNYIGPYINNQYASMSGTSMAAPHATGIALIGLLAHTDVITDPVDNSVQIPRWRVE